MFSDLVRFVQTSDAKERVGCGKQREAEFEMEDLPFGRIAALLPVFAVKDLRLGRTLMMMILRVVIGISGSLI